MLNEVNSEQSIYRHATKTQSIINFKGTEIELTLRPNKIYNRQFVTALYKIQEFRTI